MTWYTTKVSKLDQLQSELRRLQTAGHTIQNQLTIDGFIVIISTTV